MTESRQESESAFDRVVHEYYQAIENGRSVDPHQFVESHPEFRKQLKSFFADVECLGKAARGISSSGTVGLGRPRPHDESFKDIGPGKSLSYLGQYRILEELARGGMGVVFKARHEKLKRTVALKMILSGRFASDLEVARFRVEARAAASLSHPGIVSVHEIGAHEGHHYFTMDYIESESLSARLQRGSLTPQEAATMLKQLAEATHYAHQKGVLHRDLKPGNVLIDLSGNPHITDFGLAKPFDQPKDATVDEITFSGQILGTPSYMSPEQAAAKHQLVSVTSDVYSLGAILYACLSGRAPFLAESSIETLRQVISDDPVPLRVLNARVPRDMETICMKCLAKEQHLRYGSAEELVEELTRFLEGRPVLARPLNRFVKTWRIAKRNPWAALAVSLLIVLSVVSPPVAMHQFRLSQDNSKRSAQIHLQNEEIQELLDAERIAVEKASNERTSAIKTSYAASLRAAYSDWKLGRVQQLNEWVKLLGQDDMSEEGLYGWEYRYLQSLLNQELFCLEHDNPVHALSWSPGGKFLATATAGGNVYLWKPGSFKDPSLIASVEAAVVELNWNPSAKHLALALSIGDARSVEIRDIDGRLVTKWQDSTASAWSRDGKRIAVGKSDGTVYIYDVNSWELLESYKAKPAKLYGHIRSIAWSEHDLNLAVGYGSSPSDTALTIMNLDSQEQGTQIGTLTDGVFNSLDYHPEESMLLASGTSSKYIGAVAIYPWPTATSKALATANAATEAALDGKSIPIFVLHDGGIKDTCWHPGGNHFASASSDQTVKAWRVRSNLDFELINTFVGHEDTVTCVNWSPDGSYLASGSRDGTVRIWKGELEDNASEYHDVKNWVQNVSWSPDNKSITIAYWKPTIDIWNTETDHVRQYRGHQKNVHCSTWSHSGRLIASSGDDKELKIWSPNEMRKVADLLGHKANVKHVSWSPNDEFIATGDESGRIVIWRVDTLEDITELQGYGNPTVNRLVGLYDQGDPRWSRSGRFFAACRDDGSIDVFEAYEDGSISLRQELKVEGKRFVVLDWGRNEDIELLSGGDSSGWICTWNGSSWELIDARRVHNRSVTKVHWHPREYRLATSSQDGVVVISSPGIPWNLLELRPHGRKCVTCVAWSPDGERLASGGVDRRVSILDARQQRRNVRSVFGEAP